MGDKKKKVIIFKILLLGDTGVGKSELQRKHFGESFEENRLDIIGTDFAVRTMEFNGMPYYLRIWNLSNKEKFKVVREVYIRNSNGAIIVFDIQNFDSFFNIPIYLEELWKHVGLCPMVILGNNSYLRSVQDPEDIVSTENAREYCRRLSKEVKFIVPYYETSIKLGENIPELFSFLGSEIFKITHPELIDNQDKI